MSDNVFAKYPVSDHYLNMLTQLDLINTVPEQSVSTNSTVADPVSTSLEVKPCLCIGPLQTAVNAKGGGKVNACLTPNICWHVAAFCRPVTSDVVTVNKAYTQHIDRSVQSQFCDVSPDHYAIPAVISKRNDLDKKLSKLRELLAQLSHDQLSSVKGRKAKQNRKEKLVKLVNSYMRSIFKQQDEVSRQ